MFCQPLNSVFGGVKWLFYLIKLKDLRVDHVTAVRLFSIVYTYIIWSSINVCFE